MNVILVGDEKEKRDALEELVRGALPDASMACFGQDSKALEYIRSHPVDIAFLNIHPQGIDSMAVGRELRERYPRVNILLCAALAEYALTAWDLNCSAYLLEPITGERVKEALANLRYPVEEKKRVEIRCFGNFEAYCDGEPIWFKYSRTKELLAYLVDRKGARCSIKELSAVLFGDDQHRSYMYQIRLDLVHTLNALGVGDIISHPHGFLGLVPAKVKCDYFDYLEHKAEAPLQEYMTQYSFGEQTCGTLFMDVK